MTVSEKFVLFYGGVFSNFFPTRFTYEGISFVTSEQAFMYKKAMTFGDKAIADEILKTTSPFRCKQLGREVKGFDIRKWDEISYQIMFEIVYAKFRQSPYLMKELRRTRDRTLVEASPTDIKWGIGLAERDPKALIPSEWRGSNLLGKVLVEVRTRLREEQLL